MRTPRSDTISAILELLTDLAYVGEVGNACLRPYQIPEYYWTKIYRSGLLFCNPDGLVASPYLFSLLPISNKAELSKKIGLSQYDSHAWARFPSSLKLPNLDSQVKPISFEYAYRPISNPMFENPVIRPVLLYRNFSKDLEMNDWTISSIVDDWRVYSEPKKYVHGSLPVEDPSKGLVSFQEAVWNHPIYWIALQFLIFSDHQTGSAYEHKISLVLLDGFDESGKLNIYLNDLYICDFREILISVLEFFGWHWVNQTSDVVHVFKLLYKIEIMDKERNGQALLTTEFRRNLFERNSVHFKNYKQSRPPRDTIREMIQQKLNRL
jgi:hypothetical protein